MTGYNMNICIHTKEKCAKIPISKFRAQILEVIKVHWLDDERLAQWSQDNHIEIKVLCHLNQTDWSNLPTIKSILELARTIWFYIL
jgi:hypothetical protein